MSIKGTTTTSDYLDFEKMMFKSKNMLQNEKTRIYGLYIIIAINTGLRSGDLLKLTYDDLRTDKLTIIEGKTKKTKLFVLRLLRLRENK